MTPLPPYRRSFPPCTGPALRRRAYVMPLVLFVLALLLPTAIILGQYAAGALIAQRRHRLAASAAQILASAQAWTRAHPERLTNPAPIRLPLDELLTPAMTGVLELHAVSAADHPSTVACRLTLRYGRLTLTRQVTWPASALPPTNLLTAPPSPPAPQHAPPATAPSAADPTP